ncbi:odorant receptor 13a-like isoform X2 [Osmia lignaria lignaria]|uniref:odorant receptor 13a-like isoform X2 n=1 Tax=Osmia lignaria lignaria TaxID=1437193 RepID=UPI001478FF2F|nr:odorant receptor 13a-like [Osmia lignaria]
MDAATLEKRYLKVTKRFVKLSGIWPSETKFSKYLARFIINLIVVPALVTQAAKVVCFFSMNVAVEDIPFMTALIGILTKQWTYIVKEKKFKLLLDGIYEDWAIDRSKEELNIMTTYAIRGAFLTSFYVGNAYFCVIVFISQPHISRIFDKITSHNESRNRLFIYPAYYAIDEEKYYYAITAHMSSAVISALLVYSACDTMYMFLVQHACSLLAVAGYRFKHAIDFSIDEKGKNVDTPNEIHRKVCYAVQGHERANLYLKEIENIHFHYLLISMMLVMLGVTVTLFKISVMKITSEFYKYCSFLIIQLMHIFFLSIQGQFLANVNDEIYNNIYEAMWYNAPVKTQALYVLALRRALTPLQLTAGGFVTMNLQSFADVIKTSVSYFTVLESVQ